MNTYLHPLILPSHTHILLRTYCAYELDSITWHEVLLYPGSFEYIHSYSAERGERIVNRAWYLSILLQQLWWAEWQKKPRKMHGGPKKTKAKLSALQGDQNSTKYLEFHVCLEVSTQWEGKCQLSGLDSFEFVECWLLKRLVDGAWWRKAYNIKQSKDWEGVLRMGLITWYSVSCGNYNQQGSWGQHP